MFAASLAVIAAATPSPAPSGDGGSPDPAQVTPGTIGFIATALVVIATVFLIRDAVKRVRRVRAADNAQTVSHYPIERRPRVRPADGGDAVPADQAERAQRRQGEEAPDDGASRERGAAGDPARGDEGESDRE